MCYSVNKLISCVYSKEQALIFCRTSFTAKMFWLHVFGICCVFGVFQGVALSISTCGQPAIRRDDYTWAIYLSLFFSVQSNILLSISSSVLLSISADIRLASVHTRFIPKLCLGTRPGRFVGTKEVTWSFLIRTQSRSSWWSYSRRQDLTKVRLTHGWLTSDSTITSRRTRGWRSMANLCRMQGSMSGMKANRTTRVIKNGVGRCTYRMEDSMTRTVKDICALIFVNYLTLNKMHQFR